MLRRSHARGKLRRELVIRAAKIIARSGASVNCEDIANLILFEEKDWPARAIAKAYYARLTRQEYEAGKAEKAAAETATN